MNQILAPLRLLFKVYFGLVFYTTLIVMFPLFWFFLLRKQWHPVVFVLKRFWGHLLAFSILVFTTKKKRAALPDRPYVICCNHSSYLDIVLMYVVLGDRFLFMGKSELLKWPLFNIFFKKMDIAVKRSNRLAAARSLELAKEGMDEGWSIAIFPEGTIPDHVPVMKHFKNGAFKLAIETQTPIVPITFLNNWKLFSDPDRIWGPAHPGISRVMIHDAIPTEGMTEEDLIPLRKKVKEVIESPLREYNKKEYESYGRTR